MNSGPAVLAFVFCLGTSAFASPFEELDRRYGLGSSTLPPLEWGTPTPPAPPPARELVFNGRRFPTRAFRPGDPVAETVKRAIDASEQSIRVAVYALNLESLSASLSKAKREGVKVQVVGDLRMLFPQEGEPAPAVRRLLDEGFEFRVLRGAGEFGSMHAKVGVFDGKLLLSGSYNWKDTAEDKHFENVLLTDRREELEAYLKFWEWLWANALDAKEALRLGRDPPYRPPSPSGAPVDATRNVHFRGQTFPEYAFSPYGGTRDHLIRAIRASASTIDVAMFSFYDFKLAGALLGAAERGVTVRLLLDKDQALESPVTGWLAGKPIQLRVLAGPNGEGPNERMHNKFAVFDWCLLATGSFNYSNGAETRNFEETRFVVEPADVRAYSAYFESMWRLASPPAGVGERPSRGTVATPGANRL